MTAERPKEPFAVVRSYGFSIGDIEIQTLSSGADSHDVRDINKAYQAALDRQREELLEECVKIVEVFLPIGVSGSRYADEICKEIRALKAK